MADGTERDAAADMVVCGLSGRRWNKAKEAAFFEALAETANVAHAARQAGMGKWSAYLRKKRDPAFAAAWREALAIGFEELEMQMLRQALEGSERTETVVDGETNAVKQVKKVHSFPHALAVRIFVAHRDEVERYRQFEAAALGGNSETADRVRAELAKVRARLLAEEDEDRDGEEGDGEGRDG